MIDAIVYTVATGKITRQITVVDSLELHQNLHEGEAYLLGSTNPATGYVKNGAVKSYPEKPQPFMTFDFAAEAWIDARDAEARACDLDEARQEAIFCVNQRVGRARQKFITDLPGQDVIYLRKEREAVAYLAEANPTLADYPLLSAEVGVTAATAYQVAQIWVHKSQSWQQTAAALEAIRLRGVNAIAAATTEAEAVQALHAFDAALTAASGPTPI